MGWQHTHIEIIRTHYLLAITRAAEEDDGTEVIVVVCTAFDHTVLEGKTEIMCLRKKRMPESTAIFNVEAAT